MYYIDRMLICLNKRSFLHVLHTPSPPLPIGKKILTYMKYPIRYVANRQDGRFDLTWNRTMYHCSTQLKIGTFSSCKLSGIFPFVYMHDDISNLLLDMQFYFIVYWAQRYIPTFLRTMPLEGTEGILHL